MSRAGVCCIGMLMLLLVIVVAASAAPKTETVRVSVDNNGLQGNGSSDTPSLSADGRYVVFISEASNLVTGDTNKARDVFVHDRQTRTVERVSVSSLGLQGNADSGRLGIALFSFCERAEISADGRWVIFASFASNLVPGDTNDRPDVFLQDRSTGQTERVSLDAVGGQLMDLSFSPAISADGRFIAFVTYAANVVPGDTNKASDVFVRDRITGTVERVSVGNGGIEANGDSAHIGCPSLSADGRFVAFPSTANNLVSGDPDEPSLEAMDIFVRDRLNQTTARVTVGPAGEHANGRSDLTQISGDGQTVLFHSEATNLVEGDTNGLRDVFLRHLPTGATRRASVTVNGAEATGGDETFAFDIVDIDQHGRYLIFSSAATNLVPGDNNSETDVFVKDMTTGMIRRVSLGPLPPSEFLAPAFTGVQGAISANGHVVAFSSPRGDVVPNDTNRVEDVFVRELPVFPYEYAAKIVCGTQLDADDLRLAPGLYATTINIHAPRGGTELYKKLALTIPPKDQRPGKIYPMAQHALQYDEALAVGCTNLRDEVFNGAMPSGFVEGFLVVQSTDSLDVTAVYSTAAVNAHGKPGPHSSIDVRTVAERRHRAILSVEKTGRYFCDATPIAEECVLVATLYTLKVRNDGAVPAVDVVIDDQVARSDGLPVVAVLPAPVELPPGAVFAITGPAAMRVTLAELGPAEEVEVRFWALAVVSPGSQPDVLINRVEVNAANADGQASATVMESFD